MESIKKAEKGTEKAVENTVKGMGSRALVWVAEAVTQAYNIKKSEITPKSKSAKKSKKKQGVCMSPGKH